MYTANYLIEDDFYYGDTVVYEAVGPKLMELTVTFAEGTDPFKCSFILSVITQVLEESYVEVSSTDSAIAKHFYNQGKFNAPFVDSVNSFNKCGMDLFVFRINANALSLDKLKNVIQRNLEKEMMNSEFRLIF